MKDQGKSIANEPARGATYGYFVLHTLATAQEGRTEVRSTLENLQTGEKLTFATPTELGLFLADWGTGNAIAATRDERAGAAGNGGLRQ